MASEESVIISMNPSSGATDQRALVEHLEKELQQEGIQVQVLTDIETVKTLVEESSGPDGPVLRCVVAAGGDGTVSLLANRLPIRTPIAILPLGTENLLAKYLGLSADPKLIAQMILENRTVQLDVGRANGQIFLVMASCGFDADVVHRLHAERKGHIHHWSYAMPIFRSIGQYRYPKLRISVGGEKKRLTSKWAFVFNVPKYAMNLPIVSDADPSDGLLDLCTFRGGNLIRGLFYLAAVLLRQHRKWKYSQFRRFTSLQIESDEPVPYQLDGDPGGVLPLKIEVVPNYLNLLVPKEWSVNSMA